MRSIPFLVLAVWLVTAAVAAGEPSASACRMEPARLSMTLPESGFAWLAGGDESGACDAALAKGWSRGAAGPLSLFVHTAGETDEARPADLAGRQVVAVVERLERKGFKRWTTDGRVDFFDVVAFAVDGQPNLVSAYTLSHPTAGERPLLLGDRVTFVLPADFDD